MIDKDDNVKLIDFGLSNFYQPDQHLRTSCGTVPYTAPEILRGDKYVGPEIDIWSMGVILYTMLVGSLPFADPKVKSNYQKIMKANIKYPPSIGKELKNIIELCLQPKIKNRIAIKQLAFSFKVYAPILDIQNQHLIALPLKLDQKIIREIGNCVNMEEWEIEDDLMKEMQQGSIKNNLVYCQNTICTSLYNLILNYSMDHQSIESKKSSLASTISNIKLNTSMYKMITKSHGTKSEMRNLSVKTAFNVSKQILATTKKTNLEPLILAILDELGIEYLKSDKKDRISFIVHYSPSIKDERKKSGSWDVLGCTVELEVFLLAFAWLDLSQALVLGFLAGNQSYFKDLKSVLKMKLNK